MYRHSANGMVYGTQQQQENARHAQSALQLSTSLIHGFTVRVASQKNQLDKIKYKTPNQNCGIECHRKVVDRTA